MAKSNKKQPLDYILLVCERQIQNVPVLCSTYIGHKLIVGRVHVANRLTEHSTLHIIVINRT